jgi:DNA repair exonuclease SbcCD ATPase subunit
MQQRHTCIAAIQSGMASFRSWAYGTLVGPAVEREVNAILSLVDMPRPITLRAEWKEGTGVKKSGSLVWLVGDGVVAPPFHKASGAQRFFTTLALRLACAHIAAPHTAYAQLFLDEGFTSCDEMTLEAVPSFLRQLLASWHGADVVYLVSHLESLKHAATHSVGISKGVGASTLQVGRPRRD